MYKPYIEAPYSGFLTGTENMGDGGGGVSLKFDGGGGGLESIHRGSAKYLWRSSSVSKVASYKPASLQIY